MQTFTKHLNVNRLSTRNSVPQITNARHFLRLLRVDHCAIKDERESDSEDPRPFWILDPSARLKTGFRSPIVGRRIQKSNPRFLLHACLFPNSKSKSRDEQRQPIENHLCVLAFPLVLFYFLLLPFSANPRCQRYSGAPICLLIQRARTKKRSLSRLTYFKTFSLTASVRDRCKTSRSARRQTVRHWCR